MSNRIKKIKLTDGNIYSIFDEGALRLNENGVVLTGSTPVDTIILQNHLAIDMIDGVALSELNPDVMFIVKETDSEGNEHNIVKKASLSRAREILGIVDYRFAQSSGTLYLEAYDSKTGLPVV